MASRRGLTTGEALIALMVMLLSGLIIVPIFLRSRNKEMGEVDVLQMRRVFASIAMYQEDHSGRMPSNLTELGSLVEPADLVSPLDPFADAKAPFPIEPTLPDLPGNSKQRISYAYLNNYILANQGSIRQWDQVKMQTGLLANVWHGTIDVTGLFTAKGDGPIQRIRMDGSLYTLPDRSGPGLGSFDDLFVRVAK